MKGRSWIELANSTRRGAAVAKEAGKHATLDLIFAALRCQSMLFLVPHSLEEGLPGVHELGGKHSDQRAREERKQKADSQCAWDQSQYTRYLLKRSTALKPFVLDG